VGVILTGMGKDGAAGLRQMRDAGARTLGQDADSSVVYGMPRVAWEVGAVERQLSLGRIGDAVLDLCRAGG
jgi:two-component system chemotaxis response regulator CheB